MSAIITSKFRLENASAFLSSIANESVYVMLGKSDPWPNDSAAPTPKDTLVEENDVWTNGIGLKKLDSANTIHVIPRISWQYNTVYVAWDDAPSDGEIFGDNFYVINSSYEIFKCLKSPGTASTVEPALSIVFPGFTNEPADYDPFKTSDDYIWRYMGKISSDDVSKFITTSFAPVRTITLPPGHTPTPGDSYWDSLSGDQQDQYLFQQDCKNYTEGKIYRYVVVSGGSGYNGSNPPTITVHGNGSGAAVEFDITDGAISEVRVLGESVMMDSNGTGGTYGEYNSNCGSGYTSAYVTITGGVGSGAQIRAVLSPKNGHGTDPVRELGGFYTECRVLVAGTESGAFPASGPFRQITMVKNPLNYGLTTIADATALSALKSMTVSDASGSFATGDIIEGGTSGAQAYVDSFDGTTLLYHQNDSTDYVDFQVSTAGGEVISNESAVTATIDTLGNPDVQPFSGEVMFIENRIPINRSASQVEDIRFIVEF